jgi:hypothetical protein
MSISSIQIYANPYTAVPVHFYDANAGVAGHYVSAMVLDGCYFLGASGTAQTATINVSVAGKIKFNECTFIFGGTGNWNLYGAAASAAVTPVFVELDGCSMTNGTSSIIIDTPTNFITERKDVSAGPALVLSDYPSRVIYRNTIALPSGLAVNTFTNVVPASALSENGATFLVSLFVSASGADNLACAALVHAVSRSGAGPTTAIAQSTTANIANNTTNAISLRYSATVAGEAGIDAAVNIALANGSTIYVNVIRLANPFTSY